MHLLCLYLTDIAGAARGACLPEQSIQRYEAERYRSIILGNYLRFAKVLSVRLSAGVQIR
jgi:hypothetical protein